MSDDINLLVTVQYNDRLLRCALKLQRDDVPALYAVDYYSEAGKDVIRQLLPAHVRSCGPVVAVEELFEIHDGTRKGKA